MTRVAGEWEEEEEDGEKRDESTHCHMENRNHMNTTPSSLHTRNVSVSHSNMSNINMNNLNNINNTINNTMRDSTNTNITNTITTNTNTNSNSNTTNTITNSNTTNTNTNSTITNTTITNSTITNTTITNTLLSPCQWQYPDDALYVKLFILSPLAALEAALGPRHSFGDRPRNPSPFSRIGPEFSQWTFAFTDPATQKSSRFQLRGHGVDKRSRLHDIRHVLMGETPDDRREHLLWSLRFDARFTRLLFRGNLEILSLQGFWRRKFLDFSCCICRIRNSPFLLSNTCSS